MSKNKSINKKKESKGKQSMDETWMKVLGYEMGRQTKQPAPVSWQIGTSAPIGSIICSAKSPISGNTGDLWLLAEKREAMRRRSLLSVPSQGKRRNESGPLHFFSTHARHRAASLFPPPASTSASPTPFWGEPESRSAVPPVSPFQGLEGISYISFEQEAIGSEKA